MMRRAPTRAAGAALALALLAQACALTPEYRRPDLPIPDTWRDGGDAQPGAGAGIAADWWRHFGSPELDEAIAEALAQNLELEAALQRIAQARAEVRIAGAGLLPTVDTGVNASRTYLSGDAGGFGGSGSGSGGGFNTTGDDFGGREGSVYQAQLRVAYEVDLWGRNRATRDAAVTRLTASRFERDALALVVMSDLARVYFEVLSLRERDRIARDNLANARGVLTMVEVRFREGAASGLEVAQQRTAVANTEAALATLAEQQRLAENGLAVLRGRAPATVRTTAESLGGLKVPPIAPGQPSALLERRPDIRQAEATLVAANADIGVARAALFPQITLSGNGNFQFDPSVTIGTLAAGLTAPIFQGGRFAGEVERTTAREAELAAGYRKTILDALQEVENALAVSESAAARHVALSQAAAAAQNAYAIARDRYTGGRSDFLTVLDTQAAQLLALDALAQARLAQFSAAVDLFKALGGGWQSAPE